MRRRNMLLCLVLVLACGQLFAVGNRQTASSANDIRLRMVSAWNGAGDSANWDFDWYSNPVATRIREKTGVTVETFGTMMNEIERLNLMFGSGDLPDILSAANWGGQSGETLILQRAASQGQLLPIDDYIPKYPEIQRAYQIGVISQNYLDAELKHPLYGGKMYLIPCETAGSPLNADNWTLGVYVRIDVAQTLGVDPTTIKTSQQLLDFVRRAHAYGFKDVNGNPAITIGSDRQGYEYPNVWQNFNDKKLTDFIRQSDGTVTHVYLTNTWVERNIYMWRYVNEGMFNVEAFRELVRQDEIYGNSQYLFYLSSYGTGAAKRSGIYDAHPELRYTMVGPLNWADGSPGTQLETAGRTGTPILAFPRANRYLDQTLNFLNYVNTKEGKELIRYGIEGQTFIRNAQGQPRIHPSIYAARQRGDPNWQLTNGYNLAGLGTVGRVDWGNLSMEWFGERNAWSSLTDEPEWIEFQKMKPIEQVPGYPISALSPQFPEIETLNRLDLTNSEKTWRERAYFAPTEAAARQILADFQNWVRTQENGVFMRYLNFMTQQARTRNDLAF